jgi:MFS family permease
VTTTGRDTAVVALACTAQFVDVVGVTLLIVALPAIQHDLRLSEAMLSWVATSYALVFGGVLVPGGWAADLLGRRTTFVAGSALVAAGSLVCAVAGNGAVLVTGRALQGLGAAVAVPAALALLLATLPPGPRRSRALGLWTMAGAAGGAFGFVLGGVVTQLVGWRWLFVAIGPIELLAAVLAPFLLEPVARRVVHLDLPGAVLVTAAPVLLILGLTPGLGALSVVVLVLAVLAAIAFVIVERRARAPLVPPSIWARPSFRLGDGGCPALPAGGSNPLLTQRRGVGCVAGVATLR